MPMRPATAHALAWFLLSSVAILFWAGYPMAESIGEGRPPWLTKPVMIAWYLVPSVGALAWLFTR